MLNQPSTGFAARSATADAGFNRWLAMVEEGKSLPEWSSGSRRQPAKLLRLVRIAGSNPASGFLFVPRLRPTGRDTLLKTANCVGSNPVTLPIL